MKLILSTHRSEIWQSRTGYWSKVWSVNKLEKPIIHEKCTTLEEAKKVIRLYNLAHPSSSIKSKIHPKATKAPALPAGV